ncbi:AAA domain-containing protein [Selenomonas ruminantium]|uniref:AAA domain-containing protein n=1 Tax=Selenomonas ruminantium TaxID=971 RepID=UPI0026EF7C6A|nr:AAA domain-containing protein [Selenomonas ruminantium]
MELIGEQVEHKKYGKGKIIRLTGDTVYVEFGSDTGLKAFTYPSAFENFLTLENVEVNNGVKLQLEKRKAEQIEESAAIEQIKLQKHEQLVTKRMEEGKIGEFYSVNGFCEAYKRVLGKEVDFLKRSGGKKYSVNSGKCVEVVGGQYIYCFEAEDEINIPDGSTITIWLGNGEFSQIGSIVSCEDFTIVIRTPDSLGKEVPSLEFSVETWQLLDFLGDRLTKIANHPSDIVKQLVYGYKQALEYDINDVAKGQDTAVEMCLKQPITFIWGPPGTGKTETLARISLEHMLLGHSVLMVSYSNVSVDGAIERVRTFTKNMKKYHKFMVPGKTLRYGYPRKEDVLKDESLTTYNYVIHKRPELLERQKVLLREKNIINRQSAKYVRIARELTEIRKKLKQEEKEAVKKANFVATTVSKAIVDEIIYEKKFDVVIFDEASMSYVPQIVFAASLAKNHFVCVGDFRQLPPIVQSKDASVLNQDIFQYCKITTAVNNHMGHRWLCLLDVQRRMHPDIAEFLSRNMYDNMLKTAPEMLKKTELISMLAPIPNAPLGLVDLSGMMSVCSRTMDYSRINVLSAFVDYRLALSYANFKEVGIITPYHAQARLLHAMARDAAKADSTLKKITCATVHSFQGSEQEAIIYDAVDCYRMPYPSQLLIEAKNDIANRLFNVALSRSKGKFVAVANVNYLKTQGFSDRLIFFRLMQQLGKKSTCLMGDSFCRNNNIGNNLKLMYGDKGLSAFLDDIKEARNSICIDIPDSPDMESAEAIVLALSEAKARGCDITVRAENKRNLPERLRPLAIENKYVWNPVVIIDRHIIWYGEPISKAQFKVGTTDQMTLYRPVFRWEGAYAASVLFGLLEMNKTVDSYIPDQDENDDNISNFSSWLSFNYVCDECGKPLRLIKSKYGKFFISCSGYPKCRHSELVSEEILDEYLYRNSETGQKCPKCHYTLEPKIGPRGIYVSCTGLTRHNFSLDKI